MTPEELEAPIATGESLRAEFRLKGLASRGLLRLVGKGRSAYYEQPEKR